MGQTPEEIQAQIEAAVRRYVGKVARRYAPVVAGLIAFILIIALVPSVNETTPAGSTSPFAAAQPGVPAQVPGTSVAPGFVAPTEGGSVPGAQGPAVAGPSQSGSSQTRPFSPGIARSGVRCGPGVQQTTWSKYAPPCVPRFAGNNGGATARGVTKDTITITYRMVNTTQDAAIRAAVGDAYPDPDPVYLQDMQSYMNLFNRTYELYGRKVVLKPYNGQGDYVSEDQGLGADRAAADAATAARIPAFADVTLNVKGSFPYWQALAREHVITIGPLGFPTSYYRQYYPYWWSLIYTGSKTARHLTNFVCRRMAGLKAIFAGDPAYRLQVRKFGLITPENPEYIALGNEIQAGLGRCGVRASPWQRYSINVVAFQSQSTTMVAQMKNAGVNMVICYCDPVIPTFIAQAARTQNYHPEWYQPWYYDPQPRGPNQNGDWKTVITQWGTWPQRSKAEAYKVWKIAEPKIEPRDKYFDSAYTHMMFLYGVLQLAGPNLTPETFGRAALNLPRSQRGDYGTILGGSDAFSPVMDAQIGWWDPNLKSGFDGKPGGWHSCEGGKWFPIRDISGYGPAKTQLHCFGR
jgi:hypothetical protein